MEKRISFTKELLESAASKCETMHQLILELGYKSADGGRYRYVRDRAKQLGVDISHLRLQKAYYHLEELDKETLSELVRKHKSNVSAILRELQLPIRNRFYQYLHIRAKELGVPLERRSRRWSAGQTSSNRLTPDEALVYGRVHPRREKAEVLIRCLLEIGRGENCEKCGLSNWLGTKISFDVHHLDGDSANNRRENLKVVCPNCHRLYEAKKRK